MDSGWKFEFFWAFIFLAPFWIRDTITAKRLFGNPLVKDSERLKKLTEIDTLEKSCRDSLFQVVLEIFNLLLDKRWEKEYN